MIIDMNKKENQFDFARGYAKLNKRQRLVIEYLYEHDGRFEGNYSDLTAALGRSKKVDASNIRKEVQKLHDLQIISITYGDSIKHTKSMMPTYMFLMEGWEKNIVAVQQGKLPWCWL